jgi:hypothetical protein
VYTDAHLAHVAEVVARVFKQPELICGLRMTYEPANLRFFQARFEPRAAFLSSPPRRPRPRSREPLMTDQRLPRWPCAHRAVEFRRWFRRRAARGAVKQIERKRHFRMHLFTYLAGSILIATIWAVTECNNAGGWPSHGFSQSSGQPDVWNLWIIYPILGWGLFVTIQGWFT